MLLNRAIAHLLVVLTLTISGTTQMPPQQSPRRDPLGLSLINQMLIAGGWSQLPADIMGTGTVTIYQRDGQDTRSITLKAMGPRLYRAEVQTPSGLTVTVVNDSFAASVSPSGARSIPGDAALTLRPIVFPFYMDLISTQDPSTNVRYAGSTTINGQTAYGVEISLAPPTSDPLAALRQRAADLTIWISSTTWLPIQIDYPRVAADGSPGIVTYTRHYSNYAVVQGIAVPLHQEEFIGAARVFSLDLVQVSFNNGLPQSDFSVPETAQ